MLKIYIYINYMIKFHNDVQTITNTNIKSQVYGLAHMMRDFWCGDTPTLYQRKKSLCYKLYEYVLKI